MLERFGEFKRFVTVRMAKDIIVEAPVTVVFKTTKFAAG
jgi:hypothetical protein